MRLGIKINKIPMDLGTELSAQTLSDASFRRPGMWRRMLSRAPVAHTVYSIENCEFEGLDDKLRIYPCTHRYLDRDRRWHTRATLFLRNDRLERLVLQVVEGQTAAMNFHDRFSRAATMTVGQPCQVDRYCTRWQGHGARIEARLHPDSLNADFEIALDD